MSQQAFDKYIKEKLEGLSPEVPAAAWNKLVARREAVNTRKPWSTLLSNINLSAVPAFISSAINGFDKHVKEQFAEYAPAVNPQIWENITAERERHRPKGFWLANYRKLLFIAALLLLTGAGTWWLYNNNQKNNTTESSSDKKENNTNTSNQPAANNNLAIEQFNNTENGDNNNAVNSDENNNTNPSAGFPVTLSQVPVYRYNAANAFTGETNDGDDDVVAENENPSALYGGTLMGRLLFGLQQKNNTNTGVANVLTNRKFPNVMLPGCPSIEDAAAGNKKYFEIYAGPDKAFRSFSDTGNSAYMQRRRESQKLTSAYSAGVRYTKVFGSGMSVRAGINYSQINEKFTFVQGNIVQVTYIINALGDTVGSYTVTGTRYKTTYNKYRTVDVPIVAGYELGNGKLHANINAGAMINVYSWQKGDVLDSALQPVNITTGKGNSAYGFKTNIGVGITGAISVYYKITDKLHLMAEPYYRHNLSPVNKENITLKQKFNTAGVRIGVRLDLQ